MYGNYEYASIPYGDIQTTAVIIVVNKRDLEVIFISRPRDYPFISERKQNVFRAEELLGRRI